MNKKLLGLGYPIGFTQVNGYGFFNVQLNDTMYPINLLGSCIWSNALNVCTKEESIQISIEKLKRHGYELGKDYTNSEIEDIYTILLANNLIVEFEEESDLTVLSGAKFYRKGFGVGIEEGSLYVISDGEKHCLTSLEYLIWQLSDSNKTYKEIYDYIIKNINMTRDINSKSCTNEDTDSLISKNLLSLYKKDLITIISI